MQPIDYTSGFKDPTQSMMSTASGMLQLQQARTQVKAGELALKQTQQLNDDLAVVSQSHDPAKVAQLIIKYPQLSEQFKRGYDALGAEQQKSKVNMASQAYAALLAGDNDTASSLLQGYSDAYRNSGMTQDADATAHMAELIKLHPETAKTTAGIYLASAMGPEKFQETFSKLESERRERDLEPSKLSEAQSAAREAATKADFAGSNAVMDLQKKGWDIYKIQEDVKIARENNRIAALNAAANRETNELKKQELNDKLKDAQDKRDQQVRDTATAVESSRTTIDNSLSTIDRLLKNPSLNDVIGSLEGGWVGAAKNSFSDEAQNALADIETLKSQTAINQLKEMKNQSATGASGMGALSERELDVIINSLQSMNRKQGEGQFKKNMETIQGLLLKGRTNLSKKYGLPDTIPDTPDVKPSADEIDALVKKHGGG